MPTIKYKGREFKISSVDGQRSRMYDAERGCDWGEDSLADLDACQKYANRVTSSATWARLRERHGFRPKRDRRVTTEVGRRGTGATAWPGLWRIKIAPGMMNKHVMLHELAHILVGNSVGHHWPFCRAFADLVGMFLGDAKRRELLGSYKWHHVKYRQPAAPMSEERRQKLAEQGRKALAKWKENQS